MFDNPTVTLQPIVAPRPKTPDQEQQEEQQQQPKEAIEQLTSTPIVFAELDPLGSQPYVDRKYFFHELKKPPKKALKDLTDSTDQFSSSLNDPENSFSNAFPTAFDTPPPYHELKKPPLKKAQTDGFPSSSSTLEENGFSRAAPSFPPPPYNEVTISPRKAIVKNPTDSAELFPEEENGFSNAPFNPFGTPPALPPKKPPFPEEFGRQSPFNPFVCSEEDLPPPSSPPPPPPPPRLPITPSSYSPAPPPRPPTRPPTSTSTWLSFNEGEGDSFKGKGLSFGNEEEPFKGKGLSYEGEGLYIGIDKESFIGEGAFKDKGLSFEGKPFGSEGESFKGEGAFNNKGMSYEGEGLYVGIDKESFKREGAFKDKGLSYEGEGLYFEGKPFGSESFNGSESKGPPYKGRDPFKGQGGDEVPPPLPSPARRRFSQGGSPCSSPAWSSANAPAVAMEMGAEVFCFPEQVFPKRPMQEIGGG